MLYTSANASSALKTLEKWRVTSAAKSCDDACLANRSFNSEVGSRKASALYADTIL